MFIYVVHTFEVLLIGQKTTIDLFTMNFVSFSIFPSPDQELNPSVLPAAHNTGGSLPDLTNIQFPPPLSTPLDPEDTVAFPSLSSSNSTGSLTTNLTHLGISAASHGNNYHFKTVNTETLKCTSGEDAEDF